MVISMNKIISYAIVVLIALVFTKHTCMAEKTLDAEGSGQIVNVSAYVDKAKVTIGERITYKITIDFSEGTDVLPPEIKDTIGGLAVKDSGIEESEKKDGGFTRKLWYVLETYKTGSYIMPAFDIKYIKKLKAEEAVAKTPEVFVEVVSTLDENASDIRDIRSPVAINKNYTRLYIIIAIVFGVLAVTGFVIMFLYRRKQRKIEFVPEPLSAHQIAYNELDNLRASDLISKGRIKEYYYRLSNIARRYIENRFMLMAPERTTEEFLTEMTVTDKLREEHKELVSNFLEHCDMVKFAAYGPDSREIEHSFNSAKRLVDETREVLKEDEAAKANVHQE